MTYSFESSMVSSGQRIARLEFTSTLVRGIFLMRRFMDDVQMKRAPEGGMEICMRKRLQPDGGAGRSVRV